MPTVRPIDYVSREEFEELANRLVLIEAVLTQILDVIDEWEVEEAEEVESEGIEVFDEFSDTEQPDGGPTWDEIGGDDIDVQGEPDEGALAAQREARRLQKEAAGAEAKEAAAVAPVFQEDTPPVPLAEGPLDPVEAANQVSGVGEEGRTVE